MKDKVLYQEYLVWLKQSHNITPDDTHNCCNVLEELRAMRDENTGVHGETEMVKLMKLDGSFERIKLDWETRFSILTFDEYKKSL